MYEPSEGPKGTKSSLSILVCGIGEEGLDVGECGAGWGNVEVPVKVELEDIRHIEQVHCKF